jgi:hypothetical protein
MKQFALALPLLVLPALGHAEDVWRWTDANGTLHYSNAIGTVPSSATEVKARITIETAALPGAPDPALQLAEGEVTEAPPPARPAPRAPRATPPRSRWLPGPPRIYDDARLRFGCFQGSILFAGGFSHPDDIAAAYNCLPYQLGPQAWLNAAKAELATRENGISTSDMVKLYNQSERVYRQFYGGQP